MNYIPKLKYINIVNMVRRRSYLFGGYAGDASCKPYHAKAKDPDYICNPFTGLWVKRNGLAGKRALEHYKRERLAKANKKKKNMSLERKRREESMKKRVHASDAFKKEADKVFINGIIFQLFRKVKNSDQYNDAMAKLEEIRDTDDEDIRFREKSFAEEDANWVIERLYTDELWDRKGEIVGRALTRVKRLW